jgi:hypothetical protein
MISRRRTTSESARMSVFTEPSISAFAQISRATLRPMP